VTTACDLAYTLTSAVPATTPQRIDVNLAAQGFTLPTYTSSNTWCPVSTFDVSSTNDPTFTAHTTMTYDAGNSVVKPTVASTHLDYTFYLRGTSGSTYAWAGPFELYVGCTVAAIISTTDGGYDYYTTYVGEATNTGYKIYFGVPNPVVDPAYCPRIDSVVVLSSDTSTPWAAIF
jgi:hypothetical protein